MAQALASIRAYHAIPDLDWRQERVFRCLSRTPGISANDVAWIENMDVHNVRSRVSELQRMGRVRVSGSMKDPLTGRQVNTYEVILR